MLNLIVARSRNNVIGNKDGIPWKIKGEQIQFRELTTGNVVVMGRKTYEDIGRPLPNRVNVIVSNTKYFGPYIGPNKSTVLATVYSLKEVLDSMQKYKDVEVYIAGGRRLYEEAIPLVDRMYITEVDIEVPVDETTVFFPEFDTNEFHKLTGETVDETVSYTRTVYIRNALYENGTFRK